MIPEINISSFVDTKNHSEVEKNIVIEQMKSIAKLSFFYLDGHNISNQEIESWLDFSRCFFTQSLEEKLKYKKYDSFESGFVPNKSLKISDFNNIDLRENLDVWWKEIDGKLKIMWGPLYSDEKFTRYKDACIGIFEKILSLGKIILKILSISLGKNEDFLFNQFYYPEYSAICKILHYPPPNVDIVNRDGYVQGFKPHQDYGFMTFLIQDETGGLHVKDLDGSWIDAQPRRGKILVNYGDCLERISNKYYRATPHKVYLTKTDRDRYSAAFFFDPKLDALLEPLKELLNEENPIDFEVITFGEHLKKKNIQNRDLIIDN